MALKQCGVYRPRTRCATAKIRRAHYAVFEVVWVSLLPLQSLRQLHPGQPGRPVAVVKHTGAFELKPQLLDGQHRKRCHPIRVTVAPPDRDRKALHVQILHAQSQTLPRKRLRLTRRGAMMKPLEPFVISAGNARSNEEAACPRIFFRSHFSRTFHGPRHPPAQGMPHNR